MNATLTPNCRQVTFTDEVGERVAKTVYYGLPYAEFQELKEFHRDLLRAWMDHKRWSRWLAKTIYRNAEPSKTYLSEAAPNGQKAVRGEWVPDFRPRFGLHYFDVLHQYQLQRMPHLDPASCPEVNLPEGWKGVAAMLRAFYAEIDAASGL